MHKNKKDAFSNNLQLKQQNNNLELWPCNSADYRNPILF